MKASARRTRSATRESEIGGPTIQGAPDPPGLGVFKAKAGTRFKAMITIWQLR